MNMQQELIAYLSTLASIVVLVGIGAAVIAWGNGTPDAKVAALGIGAAVTGLIGALRSPGSRSSNSVSADTVNVGDKS
jgi:malic enzyme